MAYTNIDDPSAYFQTLVFTGTGGLNLPVTHTNTGNSDLQPDLIWFKDRSAGYSHAIMDSSRGRAKVIYPDVVNAEVSSGANDDLVSFDTDGFKVGAPSNANSTNGGTTSKVAWQWKANGGTTSSNTDGTITSTVQANTDAGFNIVTYTGNGSNSNFGHGMGEQPDMVIVKNRDSSANWCVWHKNLTSSYYLQLDTTSSQQTGPWDGLDPNSGVVFVYSGGLVNASGSDYVAYIFKGKQGYSKFGKYIGNGSQNGPMVYTGFKPAFVIMKRTDNTGAWHLFDNKRSGYNYANDVLQPQVGDAELSGQTYQFVDFLSNGFKVRRATHGPNISGGTYIYMAFAENPFTTSTGIPTTAR